jgi:hypothetical protein
LARSGIPAGQERRLNRINAAKKMPPNQGGRRQKLKAGKFMSTTVSVAAQARSAPNYAAFSVEDALTLRDLQARACFVEKLLYAWDASNSGICERTLRPTRRNAFNDPMRDPDKFVGCRNDDDDAFYLQQQLQSPHDHVAELLRLLKREFGERVGHLRPREQRLMQMAARAWPGAHKISRTDAVEFALQFIRCELSAADMKSVVRNAFLIVRLTQEHVAAVEAARLALARNEPLPLARSVKDMKDPWTEEWPEWWSFEAPGPFNAPW